MRSTLSLRHAPRRVRLTSALRPALAAAQLALRLAAASSIPSLNPARFHSTQPVSPPTSIPTVSAEDTYDIVIIGGGPAGLALATAMVSHTALQDARILLLEGGSLGSVRDWDDEGPWSNRVSSLTAENVEWLQEIGAWEHIALPRSRAVDDIIVFANPEPDSHPMLHFPPQGAPLARMTENVNTQRALLRRLQEVGTNVTVREGARVAEMRYGEGRGWVGLRIGDEWVRGSLVVGADGPNSPVRQFAEIDTFGHAYNAHGVVATMSHLPPAVWPNHTAFQRFLPTGPLAFLPLADDASTMVWSTTPGLGAALKGLAPDALTLMINAGWNLPEADLAVVNDALLAADRAGTPLTRNDIADLLGAFEGAMPTEAPLPPTITGVDPKSVASFPLRLAHADAYTAHRLALVGDAAHTTHPLAGQGLNAGLADARVLAATLADARRVGADVGSITALAPYPRGRYLPNHIMLAAVDKLNWIFGSRSPLINWARGTGLEVFNELGPIKDFFMANAGSGNSRARTDKDRVYGRSYATDQLNGGASGLPRFLADATGALGMLRNVGRAAGDAVAEGLKVALRSGADALESRQTPKQTPKT